MIEQSNLNYIQIADGSQSVLTAQRINQKHDIINELHIKVDTKYKLVPSEVQPTLLCSNNSVSGCTSVGSKKNDQIETELAKKLSALLFNKYIIWKQKQKTLTNMDELVLQNN